MLSRKSGYERSTIRLVAPFGAMTCILVLLVVGVTGSLAALGDTLFPATSLGAALAQDFSSTSGWLVRWRWTHPTVAFLASIFLIWILVRAAQRTTHWDNRGPVGAGAGTAGGTIRARRSGRGAAGSGVAADRPPAGSRCAMGRACGARRATDAATGRSRD